MKNSSIVVYGTLIAMSDNVKTVSFPDGEVRMGMVSVQTEDNVVLAIEVWGDKRISYCRDNIGRRGDFVCTLAGCRSNFTNNEGEEVEFAYCRLKLKNAILDWEGRNDG